MKKLIFIYGILGGLISGGWGTFGAHALPNSVSQSTLIWLGYASMVIAFSMIFVAVKNYKDNFGGGQITFGKALQIGLLMTLVASTIYVAVWLIGSHFLYPNFLEKYMAQMKLQMQAEGKSAAVINQTMAGFAKYQNPFFNILMTYREIVPVGVVISFIAALILKSKPTTANA